MKAAASDKVNHSLQIESKRNYNHQKNLYAAIENIEQIPRNKDSSRIELFQKML